MNEKKDQVCERADELIAMLYGELSEKDAREFNLHLKECARCENELVGFGEIRQSIISWRDESLSAAWSRVAANQAPVAAGSKAYSRPSALAAIREFFNLSPMWMKAAAAFASILFCVSAIVAINHLRETQKPTVQTTSQESADQFKAQIATLKDDLAKAKAVQQETQAAKDDLADFTSPPKAGKRNEVAGNVRNMNARNLKKPLTRQERQELAMDLGLLASRDDDDLDLIDTINQAP